MKYHIAEDGIESGPLSEEEIRGRVVMGKIRSSAYVWKEGVAAWQPICSEFPGIVRPPLPVPVASTLPAVPAHALKDSPRTSTCRHNYPKWPWIGLVSSCLMWLLFASAINSIEQEALPLINEQARMETGEYVAEAGVEAFLRGAFGDPFGKADEEYAKSNAIGDRLQQLSLDYQSSASAKNMFGWLVMIFLVLWNSQHRRFKMHSQGAPSPNC